MVQLRNPDDAKSNTQVLQDAIDAAAVHGGRVVVPEGVWTVTTLNLKSGVTLVLPRNAMLRAHHNLDDYPVYELCDSNHDRQPYHLIRIADANDVTIEGDGTIDGQGPAFWDPPLPGSPWIRHRIKRPSPLLEIRDSRNVVLRDFTIVESPGWTVHTLRCRHIRVDGLKIRNHLFGPNNDGIDVTGCSDVLISNCDITGCDDNIIVKSMPDAPLCERIAVTNCILETNCANLGLGAESFGTIRDVTMTNCVIRNGLRPIMVEMWDAGLVENLTVSNVTGRCFTDVNPVRPIYLNVQYHGRKDGKLGILRNVNISGVTMTTQGRCVLTCADGGIMENITLRDIHLRLERMEDPQLTVSRSRSAQLSNDSPHTRAASALVVADSIRRLSLHNVVSDWAGAPPVPYHALWCRNLSQAVVDCPHLFPSSAEVAALINDNSELTIRSLAGR